MLSKSIRFKTTFVMFLSLVLFFIVIAIFSSKIIKNQFQQIEDQKVEENVQRLVDAYETNLENISTKLSDWSTWDDTYEFINDKNEAYIKSNLTDVTTENLKLDYMIFVNDKAEIVKYNGKEPPSDLDKLITNKEILITSGDIEEVKKGILKLESGFLMFASRPIITSQQQGPIRGSLIFASYLDKEEIDRLSQIVHLSSSIASLNENYAPDKDFIYGYSVIDDFFGTPAFQFRIKYPRDISRQGERTISYFLWAFLLSGSAFLLLIFTYLDKILISKITDLSNEVKYVGKNEEVKITQYKGGDEISILAESIDSAIKQLRAAEERFTVFMNNVPNVAWIKDSTTWKYLYVNKSWEDFFKRTIKEMVNQTDFDIWSKEIADSLRVHDEEVLKQGASSKIYEDVPDPSGNVHHWLVYKFSLTSNGKKLIAGIATDITDQKKHESDLMKKSSELEKMNQLMVGRELKMKELKDQIQKLTGGDK